MPRFPLTGARWLWFTALLLAILLGILGHSCHAARSPDSDRIRTLDQRAQPFFDQAHRNVAPTVQALTDNLTKLGLLLAKDKLSGGSSAQKYLREALREPILNHCQRGAQIYGVSIDDTALSGNARELAIGNVSWRSRPLYGTYPNWRQVVPQEKDLPYKVKFTPEEADRFLAFLKTVPDNPPYHPVTLTMEKQTLVVKAKELSLLLEAESSNNWQDYEVSVSRDILQRTLLQGHHELAFNQNHGPFTAAGGIGEPLAVKPVAINQTQKEEPKMNIIAPKVVAAPVQSVANNEENELNPMDELANAIEEFKGKIRLMLEESAALSRKVKEVMLSQKQKERDFIQAKRAIERIRMAI